MSDVAVVTGASGFVGGAVVRHLLGAGFEVRGVARSRAAAARIEVLGSAGPPDAAPGGPRRAVAVEGDVLAADSLAEAFAGADLVVHAAGTVAACPRDPGPMLRTNVVGTTNAVSAAARAGVGRLVLTSSAATIGERAGRTGTERTTHRGWFLSAYERSKAEAEAVAFTLGRDLGVEVVAVNPASVQGPGRSQGTARLLLAAARGRLPIAIRTTLSFVDVDDCAGGHVLAARLGAAGERYLLCGASMRVEDALEIVRRLTRRRGRPILLPPSVLQRVAGPIEAGFRLLRREPPVCRAVADAVAHGRVYDGSRAERDLGLRYTPPEETLRRTLSWFAEVGLLGSTGGVEATMGSLAEEERP